MAYSNFTLETVKKEFQLELVELAGIFAEIEPVVSKYTSYNNIG